MNGRNIGLPAGFRDLLFDQAKTVRTLETQLSVVFELAGYREIVPSTVEYFDLYSRGNQLVRKDVYRFLDRDDNLLALRADFTPAIARIVCSRLSTFQPPVKVWYSGTVFRKVDPQRGPYREVRQVGAELMGLNSITRDAEIINTAMSCLEALGLKNAQVHINHAGIFRGVIDSLGLTEEALRTVQSEIERKDTRALEGRLREIGVSDRMLAQLQKLTTCIGGPEVLQQALSFVESERARDAIQQLQQLAQHIPLSDDRIVFDLTESDEMEYYTGVMFKLFVPRLRHEIGGGGRYDSLLSEFGAQMPAVGFSLSVDSILSAL
ncbi:MAG: ATP phosphoribosyltransferase regulatory subunit [Ignavibacteria bacterium]|nr:ATP phosphoribosyltransferase regulatory subunit [Ignavibacteria bacterium]